MNGLIDDKKRSVVPTVQSKSTKSLSVHNHIFRTTRAIFTNFFVHATRDRGSVLVWRRIDTLCTSGFMNDVIFAPKLRLLDVAAQLKRSAHAALGLAVNCTQ